MRVARVLVNGAAEKEAAQAVEFSSRAAAARVGTEFWRLVVLVFIGRAGWAMRRGARHLLPLIGAGRCLWVPIAVNGLVSAGSCRSWGPGSKPEFQTR